MEQILQMARAADGVERKVDAAGRLTTHDLAHPGNRVFVSRVDAERSTKLPGELELFVGQVDDDDRVRAQVGARLDDRQPYPTGADDDHRVTRPHLGGIQRGAGAGHDRAADDRGHVGRDAGFQRDDHLLIGDGVARPGKGTGECGRAEIDLLSAKHDLRWRRPRRAAGGVALHPGDHYVVALFDMRDVLAHAADHAGCLVTEDQGHQWIGPVQLVELRVTDTRGEVAHQHLGWARVRQVNVVDDHRFARLDEDGGGSLHTSR
jgi:hypothetical protein